MVKPVNMDELLRTVEQHLKKQKELKEYGQERLAEFVETRIKELDTEDSTPRRWQRKNDSPKTEIGLKYIQF